MTDYQRERFHTNGCLPRCLVKLCEIDDHPTSDDVFCQQFEHLFLDLAENYGRLRSENDLQTIIQQLELPTQRIEPSNYQIVDREYNLNLRHLMMVWSEINLDPDETDSKFHSSVLTKIDSAGFSLWSPCQDGSARTRHLVPQGWKGKGCFAVGWHR